MLPLRITVDGSPYGFRLLAVVAHLTVPWLYRCDLSILCLRYHMVFSQCVFSVCIQISLFL